MGEQKNIPELRFPEFNGEWERKKIIDFAPLQRGFDLPVDKIREGKYPVVFSNGILKYHNEYKVKGPGVVTGRSGTIGKVTYVEDDFWAHNTSLWVTNFNGNHPKFVYYFYYRYKLENFATGSGVPTLNRNDIHNQKECFALLPEQQKIASFFTFIDKKISQLKQKKTLLEQYKKGVMQKIFSQNIRFRDENGQEFPKWEKKKIVDLAIIKYGKDQKQIECDNGLYPILGTGGEMGRTNEYLYNKPSVLIGRKGTIDKPQYMDSPFWTVDTLFYTDIFQNTIPKWLFYLFGTINWYKYNEASGVPSLSASTINSIPIEIPSIKEQTKIANFLSAIDTKINHTQSQIENAERWKKGLLQKMFV